MSAYPRLEPLSPIALILPSLAQPGNALGPVAPQEVHPLRAIIRMDRGPHDRHRHAQGAHEEMTVAAFHLLAATQAHLVTLSGALDARGVDTPGGGLRESTLKNDGRGAKRLHHFGPHTLLVPGLKIIINRTPSAKVSRM